MARSWKKEIEAKEEKKQIEDEDILNFNKYIHEIPEVLEGKATLK